MDNSLLNSYILGHYNYEIDKYKYGTFSRKDNNRCLISFSIEEDSLKIENFQCFPPIGNPSLTGVPRSGGAGREMMLNFLMFIKMKYPDIQIVYLYAHAFPDSKNMNDAQYQEYYSDEKLPLYKSILIQYYNSLGFTINETDGLFYGHIDHIIFSIQNYDKMKSFNSNIHPDEERKMFEEFGIDIIPNAIFSNVVKSTATKSSSKMVKTTGSKKGGKTNKKRHNKKRTKKRKNKRKTSLHR